MSSQLDQAFGSYLNGNAAALDAYSVVKISASPAGSVDLVANGGAAHFGVLQEDVAIAGYALVKLSRGDGTFMIRTAAATTAGTAYSLDATGAVVAVGSSPNDVAIVRAVVSSASGAVGEFYFI